MSRKWIERNRRDREIGKTNEKQREAERTDKRACGGKQERKTGRWATLEREEEVERIRPPARRLLILSFSKIGGQNIRDKERHVFAKRFSKSWPTASEND